MSIINNALFIVLPYVALAIFLLGTIYRYKNSGFQYSSLSSQFLEGKKLFWGTLPFHFGLLIILIGHFIAFIFPSGLLAWNSEPIRLIILEGTGIIFGLCSLIGIIALLWRRLSDVRVKIVSNKMDIIIEMLILFQIILGVFVALSYRWGSSWFASDLSPYLWSILLFNPKISLVVALPLFVQLHIVGAFFIILIFPFTRLVHVLVAPFHYIFRPYQQVIWYWDRKKIRKSTTVWTHTRPNNN